MHFPKITWQTYSVDSTVILFFLMVLLVLDTITVTTNKRYLFKHKIHQPYNQYYFKTNHVVMGEHSDEATGNGHVCTE